jgi:RNA polymerase sigma-70 factor (ECF subfamily)
MAAVAAEPPATEQQRPDEWAAQRELAARLEAVFESLPTDLRVAFTLCDIEGMRGVDVARALKLPEGTVWRRLHDARLRLRAVLGDEVGR